MNHMYKKSVSSVALLVLLCNANVMHAASKANPLNGALYGAAFAGGTIFGGATGMIAGAVMQKGDQAKNDAKAAKVLKDFSDSLIKNSTPDDTAPEGLKVTLRRTDSFNTKLHALTALTETLEKRGGVKKEEGKSAK